MRKGRKYGLWLWVWMTAGLLLSACGEDAYHYPSVRLEFLTAYSDVEGQLDRVVADDGKEYPVWTDDSGSQTRPDSLVRIISNYEVVQAEGTEGVRLYAVSAAIAPVPLPADKFADGVKTDPVDVLSIWLGRNYLNLMLEVKAQHARHQFHFVENRVTVDAEARRSSVELTLYHDDGGDTQAYTQRAYCSVPLAGYAVEGVDVVELDFHVHTYSGEVSTYHFEYIPIL